MSRSSRNGLSLLEALVVIGILVVVIGLFLTAVPRLGGKRGRTQCQNNVRQLILALHNYTSIGRAVELPAKDGPGADGGPFPPGCIGRGATPEDRLSWMVALLPILEHQSLYEQFDFEKGYAGNLGAAQTKVETFLCDKAAQPDSAVTHYVAMSGIGQDAARQVTGIVGNGFMGYDRLTSPGRIKDGLSSTIAIIETRQSLGSWARGGSSTLRGFDPDVSLRGDNPPFGGHEAGFNAAMADGSCRFISFSINPKILAAAITIANGDKVDQAAEGW